MRSGLARRPTTAERNSFCRSNAGLGTRRESKESGSNRVINSTKRRGKKPLPDVSVDELLWEVAVLTWPQQPVAQEKREMPTREVGS